MAFTLASTPIFFITDKVGEFNKYSRMENKKRKKLMKVLNENVDNEREDYCDEWDDEYVNWLEGRSNLQKLLRDVETASGIMPRTFPGNYSYDLNLKIRRWYEYQVINGMGYSDAGNQIFKEPYTE